MRHPPPQSHFPMFILGFPIYILDLRFTKFDIVEPLRIGHPQSSKTMSPNTDSFSVVNFYSASAQEIGSCHPLKQGFACKSVFLFVAGDLLFRLLVSSSDKVLSVEMLNVHFDIYSFH